MRPAPGAAALTGTPRPAPDCPDPVRTAFLASGSLSLLKDVPGGQPGSRGGAAWAASAALADSMTESTAERCASSFARARRSAAEASALACGLLAASTSATSDCTRSASGDAQVTRPLTTRARRKLASDSVTWYWVRSVSSSLLAGEQLAAPSL